MIVIHTIVENGDSYSSASVSHLPDVRHVQIQARSSIILSRILNVPFRIPQGILKTCSMIMRLSSEEKYSEVLTNLTVIAALCACIWLECFAPKSAFFTPQRFHRISTSDSEISGELLHVVFSLANKKCKLLLFRNFSLLLINFIRNSFLYF